MREQAQNSSQGLENKKSKQIHGTSLQILPPKNLATRPKTIMLLGKSGCGKSDLAFRLISQGRAKLISDDQTIIERRQNALFASAPKSIFGKLEIRHIGIVKIGALKTGKLDAIIYLETSPKKLKDCLGQPMKPYWISSCHIINFIHLIIPSLKSSNGFCSEQKPF